MVGDQAAQTGGIHWKGLSLLEENMPDVNAWKLATPMPSDRLKVWPLAVCKIIPVRSRARVRRTLTAVRSDRGVGAGGGRHIAQQLVQVRLAVHAAGFEVAPAAVIAGCAAWVAAAGGVSTAVAAVSMKPSSKTNQRDCPCLARDSN